MDQRRAKLLETYPDPTSFRTGFTLDNEVLQNLEAQALIEEIEPDTDGMMRSKALIELRLKALIARDLWNTSAYWQMINAENPVDRSFQKALEALQDNMHQRLGMVRQ